MTGLGDIFRMKCRALATDEGGSALALTLAFLLPVYLLAIGLYGISETVRRKIELQNAADAAAYSAATVQADYLSRIAVLNKAIGWAYADLTRRQMDWAMCSFTEQTTALFTKDVNYARSKNSPSCHPKVPGVNWNAGWTPSWLKPLRPVLLIAGAVSPSFPFWLEEFNDLSTFKRMMPYLTFHTGMALFKGKGTAINSVRITGRSGNLLRMTTKLSKIVGVAGDGEMKKAIVKAANDVLDLNTREIDDEVLRYVRVGDPWKYVTPLRNNSADEQILLQHAVQLDKEDEYRPVKFFDKGIGYWLQRSGEPLGSFRVYRQQKKHLHAEWSYFWTRWGPHILFCWPPLWRWEYKDRKYDADKSPYHLFNSGMPLLAGAPAIAYTLNAPISVSSTLLGTLFGREGTIVVGLARENVNPLRIFGGGMSEAFDESVCGGHRPKYIWALSAARAAYNSKTADRSKYGEMKAKMENPSYTLGYSDAKGKSRWNLCETDWDAMFVPVGAANDLTLKVAFLPDPTKKNILAEIMLDKDGWKKAEGNGRNRKWKSAGVDWSKLPPPGGLAESGGDKRLDWKGLSSYLCH